METSSSITVGFFTTYLPIPPAQEKLLQPNPPHFSTFKYEMLQNVSFEYLNVGFPASICSYFSTNFSLDVLIKFFLYKQEGFSNMACKRVFTQPKV